MRKSKIQLLMIAASYCLLFATSLAFRFDSVSILGLHRSWEEGLGLGIFYDLVISALPFWLYFFLAGLHQRSAVVAALLADVVFITAALASALYFRFFGSKLYWWIVIGHTGDTASVWDAILQLARHPLVVVGLVFGILSVLCLVYLFRSLRPERYLFKPPSQLKYWPVQALLCVAALGAIVSVEQFPMKHRHFINRLYGSPHDLAQIRSPVSDHFLVRWGPEWSSKRTFGDFNHVHLGSLNSHEQKIAAKFLASMAVKRAVPPEAIVDSPFPALRTLAWNDSARSQWRKALGFAENEKMNVVLLFMESVRGYEYFHPELGQEIFPNLHRLAKSHAITFKKYYTVSTGAGTTVRGMFASLCSQYPNPIGPAPYLSNPSIRASCLPELLGNWNFNTHMFVASSDNYHNKRLFESRHGTQNILGSAAIDPSQSMSRSSLGILDTDYFKALIDYLVVQAKKDKPFLLHGINVGTHIPWKIGKKPIPELARKFGSGDWLGLVSSFHDYDENIGTFIESFLARPELKNTVLILVSDHSNIVSNGPDFWGTPAAIERGLRVPLFFFSQRLTKPAEIEFPVSQLDLAPTLANILRSGSPALQATFMGQTLDLTTPNSGSLRAYMYPEGRTFYADSYSNCYQENTTSEPACYLSDSQNDPLFAKTPRIESPTAKSDLEFARKLVESSFFVTSMDRLLPKNGPQIPPIPAPVVSALKQ